MEEQTTSTLNEFQELLHAIEQDAERTNLAIAISQDLERSISEIEDEMDTSSLLGPLATALQSDVVDDVRRVMAQEEVGESDPIGSLKVTLVHFAAYFGAIKTLSHFCSLSTTKTVNLNARTRVGDNPLMFALYGAKSDDSAAKMVHILLSAERPPDCNAKNIYYLLPLYVALMRNFTRCSELLTSPARLKQYAPPDLLCAIKLALVNDEDSLVNTLRTKWPLSLGTGLIQEIRKTPSLSEELVEILEYLERTKPNVDERGYVEKSEIENTSVDSPDIVEDANGKPLKPGDVVETLSPQMVKRAVPASVSEEAISKLSECLALIHELRLPDRIYIEISGKGIMAHLRGVGVRYVREGPVQLLADNTIARVGSYVQVLSDQELVREQTGQAGWVHGMADTLRKTGKAVRIFKNNSDILVQFAWGPRYYYKPKALIRSSAEKVETQDAKGKWIGEGVTCNVHLFRTAFAEAQQKYGLPHEGSYGKLPLKYVTLQRVSIKAFSPEKTVVVRWNGREYRLNVESLSIVETVKDRSGAILNPGDEVRVTEEINTLKAAQKPEFGGWRDSLAEYAGQKGKLLQIHPSTGEGNGVVMKIKFGDGKIFFFNPRAVSSGIECNIEIPTTSDGSKDPITPAEDKSTGVRRIKREDLICLNKLGEGAFGCVYRGNWFHNGERKEVAVKQIKSGVTSTVSFSKLMAEAETQYELSHHPNIVSLYGVSYLRDLWMVLEFINGSCLNDLLFPENKESPVELSFRRKVKLCLDMCNAIAFVHNKGYLHCDIKPQNMMVDLRTDTLYVLDFGITRYLGSTSINEFATEHTNSVAGTLYYIPPECLQPDERGKYRRPKFSADVWALGAVFFELFTRSRISTDSLSFLHDKIKNKDGKVKACLSRLPEPVIGMVSRALDFDRKARPTAQELAEFFHEAQLRYE